MSVIGKRVRDCYRIKGRKEERECYRLKERTEERRGERERQQIMKARKGEREGEENYIIKIRSKKKTFEITTQMRERESYLDDQGHLNIT